MPITLLMSKSMSGPNFKSFTVYTVWTKKGNRERKGKGRKNRGSEMKWVERREGFTKREDWERKRMGEKF